MNLNELKDQVGPLSPSMIRMGLQCPRKFLYRYRWGLVPRGRPYAPSADVGQLTHRLLELGQVTGVEIVKKEVRDLQDDLCERIGAGEDLTGGMTRTVNELGDLFNKARVMAEIFWEKYPPAENEFVIIAKEKRLFGGRELFPPYGLSGKIDRLVQSNDGSVWIRDTKCTSLAPIFFLTGITWSIQHQMYGYLAQEFCDTLVEQPRVAGFIWDILQMPGIKYCNKDKDWASYLERVKDWYKKKEETEGTQPIFSRSLYYNLSAEADEYFIGDELQEEIYRVRILNTHSLLPVLFRRDVTCENCKYNRQICPYYILCSSNMENWPVIIERSFEVRVEEDREEEKNESES